MTRRFTHHAFRPFVFSLFFTAVLFTAAFWIPNLNASIIVATVSLLLGLPVTILLYRDGVRAVSLAAHGDGSAKVTILSLPVRLFGCTTLLLGLGVLVALAYKTLIDRQLQPFPLWAMSSMFFFFGLHLIWRPLDRSD